MQLGYACINLSLSKSNKITTNRSMIKNTFLKKGISYAGELALLNCIDLIKILVTMDDNFGNGDLWLIGVSINQLEIKNGLAELKF